MKKSVILTRMAICGILLVGCSSNSSSSQKPPQQQITVISDPSRFSQRILPILQAESSVPVVVPRSIDLDRPIQHGDVLAATVEVSSTGYGIDIFVRPSSSGASIYGMASLKGTIEATTHSLAATYFDRNKSKFTQERSIKLPGKISALYDDSPNENLVTWHDSHWVYITSGVGTYETGTVDFADTIANFIAVHGEVIHGIKSGYVEALWAGNQPDFNVTWTYNNKVWYSIHFDTLTDTLNTAYTV